ncbi:hypothetical protein ACQ4PT_048433 [Festuca glaucescens]
MAELPPGYRFYPTEEELVRFYLRHKLDGSRCDDIERVIPVADVCSLDPWQLPGTRTTPSGYWKAAGTPGLVYSADGRPVGTKKTMVFYCGRAPAGAKTDWKMNEYRAFDDDDADAVAPAPNPFLQARSEFSLCRLYTRLDNLRQFDRRPCTAARGSASQDLASSSAAAALANEDDEAGRGQKRKRHAATDGTSSSSDDADRSMQQQHQEQGDADEELLGDMADWAEFLDWI